MGACTSLGEKEIDLISTIFPTSPANEMIFTLSYIHSSVFLWINVGKTACGIILSLSNPVSHVPTDRKWIGYFIYHFCNISIIYQMMHSTMTIFPFLYDSGQSEYIWNSNLNLKFLFNKVCSFIYSRNIAMAGY